MKPTHPISPGEDSRGTLRLDPALADVVTTLVTVVGPKPEIDPGTLQQRLAVRLTEYPGERAILVAGLTRCLADSAYLRVYLRHLRKLWHGLLPYEELPRDRVKRVLRHGPGKLKDGELAWLALAPEQLQTLRDLILRHFPRFWVEAVDEAMSQAAREQGQPRRSTHELLDEIRGVLEGQAVPAVFGTSTATEPAATGDAARPVLYQGTWVLEAAPAAGWPADLPRECSVMAVLVEQDEGRELRFLNAPLDKAKGWVVELRRQKSPDAGRPTEGGFAFATLSNDPPQIVLEGRARPKTAPDDSGWGALRVTLARETQP